MSSSATAEPHLEFRCNRCWHSNCVPSSWSGRSVSCSDCDAEVLVPEATPERIERAEALMREDNAQGLSASVSASRTPQSFDADIQAQIRQETHVPLAEMDFSGAGLASPTARLLAYGVDALLDVLAVGTGVGLLMGGIHWGLIEEPPVRSAAVLSNLEALGAMVFPLIALKIIQWNLIATTGQTLGKMLLAIRIVTVDGRIPGLLSGVVLRNWLRAALTSLPFFGLVDILFIFSDSQRCLHDYLAGTRVVNT